MTRDPADSAESRERDRRRRPSRVGDMLPRLAAAIGLEGELRIARQIAAWERLVEELVPAASGSSRLLAVQPPALVVSATSPLVGQEMRLRQAELLEAFARLPEGERLIELRVVVRHPGRESGPR